MTNIHYKGISKKFESNLVLNNISLTIEPNQVHCLLGRNGAGKSTLINIACNIIKPDAGSVTFGGVTYGNHTIDIYKNIGLQSQFDTLIEELNTYDYLLFIGRIYNMNKVDIASQVSHLTAYFFESEANLNKPIKSYSTGMRKKVMLCAALLHKPQYLFLDEPFSNIDPISANALCKLIQAYQNKDRCILISSHDLLYVNKVATHIAILENGGLVYNDEISNFRTGAGLDEDLLQYIKPKTNEDMLLTKITQ